MKGRDNILKMFEVIKQENMDDMGLITQKDGDSGDQAHRHALLYAMLYWLQMNEDYLGYTPAVGYLSGAAILFDAETSKWRRGACPNGAWWTYWDNFSRDQMIPTLIALGIYSKHDPRVKDMFHATFKLILNRLGFHTNIYPNGYKPGDEKYKTKMPDLITPGQVATYLRYLDLGIFGSIIRKVALNVLDLSLIFDIWNRNRLVAKKLKEKPFGHIDHDLQLVLQLASAENSVPTLVSRLATRYYKKTTEDRPSCAEASCREQIRRYFDPKTRAAPLYEIYFQVIDRLFGLVPWGE